MSANAVKEAAAMAQQCPPPDADIHREDIRTLQSRIRHHEALKSNLLPIERQAKNRISTAISEMEGAQIRLESETKRLFRLKNLRSLYRRLSLEPLTWRDPQGYPKLATFALDSEEFKLESTAGGENISPRLGRNICVMYEDVLGLLRAKRKREMRLQLRCHFEGLIPKEVKEKIRVAQETFHSEEKKVFIIAEAGAWTLEESAAIPEGDPLVVGYDPETDPESLWLITEFDVTPVEEAMICAPVGEDKG